MHPLPVTHDISAPAIDKDKDIDYYLFPNIGCINLEADNGDAQCLKNKLCVAFQYFAQTSLVVSLSVSKDFYIYLLSVI